MTTRALLFFCAIAALGATVQGHCEGYVAYRVSNVCNWSPERHPTDYPSNSDFSPLCSIVHNQEYSMFEMGGLASPGVQDVAERGMCATLASEIEDCVTEGYCGEESYASWPCDKSQNAEGVPGGVCSHSGIIVLSPEYTYFSAVSMVGKSPDWFVGVSSVNLCQEDAETGESYWVSQYPPEGSRPLYGYDAGTDAGTTFNIEDAPMDPHEPISVFDAEDASNIFYNQEQGMLYPLCEILLEKAF